MKEKIKVAIFDDHPILLAGIASLLQDWRNGELVGSGRSACELYEVVSRTGADVAVVDMRMPGSPIEAIADLATRLPHVRILAFTASTNIDLAVAALEAGCTGYLLKGCTVDELKLAIETVHAGETFITPAMAAKVIAALRAQSMPKPSSEQVRLSSREEQVLKLLLRGGTNKEIGRALSISDKTVKHYMTILMQKLNARNRIEAVLAAQQLEKAHVGEAMYRRL